MALAVRKEKVQIWGLAIQSYLQQWKEKKRQEAVSHYRPPLPPQPNTCLPSQNRDGRFTSCKVELEEDVYKNLEGQCPPQPRCH